MTRTSTPLREAVDRSGLTLEQVADMVGTNAKTVQRWLSGRQMPYRTNRRLLADILEVPTRQLWPDLEREAAGLNGLVALYPTRADLPASTIAALIHGAGTHIDIMAYSATWLWDAVPRFGDLLANKAREGVQIRLCLGDPESEAVAKRGEEERVGGNIAARCRLALSYAAPIIDEFDDSVRLHATTLYTSVFRFDGDLLVNWHLWGRPAAQSPLFHFNVKGQAGVAASVLNSFEQVWRSGQAVGAV